MKKFLLAVIALFIGFSAYSIPVAATNGMHTFGVEASVLKNCADRGNNSDDGDGVICILELVVDILSIGIGILGVIGITIVGIQYLTAGGSEENTRKAKRRMLEIVIGLAGYAVIYALLKWLLPVFGAPA